MQRPSPGPRMPPCGLASCLPPRPPPAPQGLAPVTPGRYAKHRGETGAAGQGPCGRQRPASCRPTSPSPSGARGHLRLQVSFKDFLLGVVLIFNVGILRSRKVAMVLLTSCRRQRERRESECRPGRGPGVNSSCGRAGPRRPQAWPHLYVPEGGDLRVARPPLREEEQALLGHGDLAHPRSS